MDTDREARMSRWHVIIGAALILLGIFWLFGISISTLIAKLWPLALIALGLYLLLKMRSDDESKRAGEGGTSTLGMPGLAGEIRISGLANGVGSVDKSVLLGDIVIDLTGAKLLDGDNYINATLLLGDIVITYPENFPVSMDLSCCIGDLSYKQKHVDGILPKMKHKDDNFETASSRLIIKCRICVGDVRVTTTS